MIKIAQTGFMAAKNFGKKHFATAVKSMKEMKAKVKMPNKSSFKSFGGKAKTFGTKHKVALVAGGGAAGTVIATFKFGAEGINYYVPGSGILFEEGVYLDLTATPGVTITFT